MIIIRCPKCGRGHDFSQIREQVTDWKALVPILAKEPCASCRLKAIGVESVLVR